MLNISIEYVKHGKALSYCDGKLVRFFSTGLSQGFSIIIMIVGLSFVHSCFSVEANVSNLFSLFLMAIVCDRLPWDLAITCAISSSTGTITSD